MAFVNRQHNAESAITASAVNPYVPVALDTVADQVVPVATNNVRAIGFTLATAASPGLAVTFVKELSTVKAVCAASVGYGAEVGVASFNGGVGPVAGASGVARWAVGETRSPAAAGEIVSVFVQPRQISGLV